MASNHAYLLNNPRPEQIPPLHQVGAARGGTLYAVGGIFWADISALNNPLQGYLQYAGHNRMNRISVHAGNDSQITCCDCLYNNIFLKIDR